MCSENIPNLANLRIGDQVIYRMGDEPMWPQILIKAEVVGFPSSTLVELFIINIVENDIRFEHNECDIISVHKSFLELDRKSKLGLI